MTINNIVLYMFINYEPLYHLVKGKWQRTVTTLFFIGTADAVFF